MENKSQGPACSIDSRPKDEYSIELKIKNLNPEEVKKLIQSEQPSVIIVTADWCGDCKNQKPGLAKFEEKLKLNGISLQTFLVEKEYDIYISSAHEDLVNKLFNTPIGSFILNSEVEKDISTSVMGVRGRLGYPGTFLVSKGALLHWSIEDVSISELDLLAEAIIDKTRK